MPRGPPACRIWIWRRCLTDRAELARAFLASDFIVRAGRGDAARSTLAGAASFRKYERLQRDGGNAVQRDVTPPPIVRDECGGRGGRNGTYGGVEASVKQTKH